MIVEESKLCAAFEASLEDANIVAPVEALSPKLRRRNAYFHYRSRAKSQIFRLCSAGTSLPSLLRHNHEVGVPRLYIGHCDLLLETLLFSFPSFDCLGGAKWCELASCKTRRANINSHLSATQSFPSSFSSPGPHHEFSWRSDWVNWWR